MTAVTKPHTGYKKILVTGGTGFIGSHVTQFLLGRGDGIVVADEMNDYYGVKVSNLNLPNQVSGGVNGSLLIYCGNVCDADFMLDVFEIESPQWICHMAAHASFGPSIQNTFVYMLTSMVL